MNALWYMGLNGTALLKVRLLQLRVTRTKIQKLLDLQCFFLNFGYMFTHLCDVQFVKFSLFGIYWYPQNLILMRLFRNLLFVFP